MTSPDDFLRIGAYLVSPELFTRGFATGVGPWACTGECCARGAYVDVGERDAILAHAPAITAQLDESQTPDASAWFEPGLVVDHDFPSGTCAGTAVDGGKCRLQDQRGRCSIQAAAIATLRPKWEHKPLYCVLYPLTVIEGVLRWHEPTHARPACCTASANFDVPLFEACRAEVVHLLGEQGFAALQAHYATHYATQPATSDAAKLAVATSSARSEG